MGAFQELIAHFGIGEDGGGAQVDAAGFREAVFIAAFQGHVLKCPYGLVRLRVLENDHRDDLAGLPLAVGLRSFGVIPEEMVMEDGVIRCGFLEDNFGSQAAIFLFDSGEFFCDYFLV